MLTVMVKTVCATGDRLMLRQAYLTDRDPMPNFLPGSNDFGRCVDFRLIEGYRGRWGRSLMSKEEQIGKAIVIEAQ